MMNPASMKYTTSNSAKMIDHSLLHPTMTDGSWKTAAAWPRNTESLQFASKPYGVKRAAELLRGTGVLVGAVIGFPHGNSATEVKRYEPSRPAGRRGGNRHGDQPRQGPERRVDYVERDIRVVCDEAHRHGAQVKSFSRMIISPTAARA